MQQGCADAVGDVLDLGLGIEQRPFPVEAEALAAQADQGPPLAVLHVDHVRPRVGEVVGAQDHVAAAGRGVDARQPVRIGPPIGEGHRAERIVVAGRGNGDRHGRQGAGRRLRGMRRGRVVAEFAEGGDLVGDVVVAGQEQVQPLDLGDDRGVVGGRGVEAQVAVDAAGGDGAVVDAVAAADVGGAAAVGRGLEVEIARGRGDQGAVATDRSGRLEVAPGRHRAAAVERGGAVEARAGEERSLVGRGGVVLVRGVERGAVGVAGEQGQVAAVEIAAEQAGKIGLPQAGPLGAAVLGLQGHPVIVGAQHGVDHAGHGVGAVEGRRAVAQHFQPLQAVHRNGVGVVGQHRDQVLVGPAGWVRHDPAAVEQHQRVADPEIAQVHRAHVAAGAVAGVRQIGRVEAHIAHLGNGAEELVAGGRGHRLDLLLSDDGHRDRLGDVRAADLRPDDDELFERRILRVGGAGAQGAQHGGGQQTGPAQQLGVHSHPLIRLPVRRGLFSCSRQRRPADYGNASG